jgi:hypothetical protein
LDKVAEITVDSVSLFISYSHVDETMRRELDSHLTPMVRNKVITRWSDRKIQAGDKWDTAIDAQLLSADIIVMMLSSDFLASEYIDKVEVPAARRRHENGEARVIPVILRDFDWAYNPLVDLQSVPRDRKDISSFSNKDTAFKEVTTAIREAAEDLRQKRRAEAERREAAAKQYRQKVDEALADEVISPGERDTLDELQKWLGLSLQDAERIETEALLPIKANAERMERYKSTLLKIIKQEYPLTELQRKDLKIRQRDLGLKEEDAAKVEAPILEKADKDHQALLAKLADEASRLAEEKRKADEAGGGEAQGR